MSNILELHNLRKSYGNFVALNNIEISIEKGRIVGLLGKNGAGKTTLIKTIIGLYKHYEGEIIYDGSPINHNDVNIMSTIGSLVDTSFHDDLSAETNLYLLMMATPGLAKNMRRNRIKELLEFVGLEENAKDRVKSFSFGMKQRLALAQSLIVEPKLLILDEPFVGLDPLGIELVKEKLNSLCREKQVSIIFSSHQLAEVAEISDDIVVIDSGKITYSGTYQSLASSGRRYEINLANAIREEDWIVLNDSNSLNQRLVITESGCGIQFPHDKKTLNQVLSVLFRMNYSIDCIQVHENNLITLFQNPSE